MGIVRARDDSCNNASRQRRGLGRRHHDPRPSRTGRTIERARVGGRIRRHSGEVSIHLVDQTDPRHRVIGRRLSQRAGHDHTGPVHAEMELPPAASPSALMFRRGPLTFADDGQSGAVNDEVQAGARAGARLCTSSCAISDSWLRV